MIHVTTVGTGKIPVVFLHGLFGQGKNFTRIAQGLRDIATCYLVDLPNHGSSSWSLDFTLDGQAELLATWLEQTFDAAVAVIGHSLGGKLAMRLALNHPDLVDRLMVVDISPASNDRPLSFAPLVAAMRSLDLERLSARSDADKRLSSHIPDPGVRGFLLQNLRQIGGSWTWTANIDLLGDSLPVIAGWPRIAASYHGATWWVAGGKSPYISPEHVEPMKALFPRTVTITLKRAGHWVHADEPEAFITLTREFLQAN